MQGQSWLSGRHLLQYALINGCGRPVFKTRALAKDAIDGGKVQVNGQRVKPSKEICLQMTLSIRQGFDEKR